MFFLFGGLPLRSFRLGSDLLVRAKKSSVSNVEEILGAMKNDEGQIMRM